MAYTDHGYHILGTRMETPFLGVYRFCGGPARCSDCKIEAAKYHHPSNTNNREQEA